MLNNNEAPLVVLEDFLSWILFEDNDLLVLDKPAWLVCHPSKNGPWSSLVGVTKEYLGVDSIHLVSRLDRETSGVVMLAKHRKAASFWQKGVEQRNVRRQYLAILKGEMTEESEISTFIGNDPDSKVFVKQRVTQESRKSQKAITCFEPLKFGNGHTFCRVTTKTGRKHQIRVHANYIGHEIIGDKLYGSSDSYYLSFCQGGWSDKWIKELGMKRQALHGNKLAHQENGQNFSAPLPPDMKEYLKKSVGWQPKEVEEVIKGAGQELSCR
jgi:23S rRNA pseudouridine1911/1915/1917 synthase